MFMSTAPKGIGPFCHFMNSAVAQHGCSDSLGPFFMDKNQTITEQILQLRQIEEKALANFTEAKNRLISIRRKIRQLQNLLTPPGN